MNIRNFKLRLARAVSLLTLLALTATTACPARAALQSELRLAEQAVIHAMNKAQAVVARTPYNFNAGVCFAVAVVRRGDTIGTDYPLQKGVDYVFFGAGDNSVQNVDLELADSSGGVLARDIAADAKPAIRHVAKSTGNYRLTLRLKKSSSASSFCSLIVMRRTGGYAVPLSALREVAKPSAQIPAEMKQYDKLMRFHRVRNEWAIYGAVLKQGDATTLSDLRFESGPHILGATSGDNRATDIDLFLSTGANQRVAEATDGGAAPGLIYQTNGNQRYNLTIANRKSQGASIIFVLAFDVTAGQTANSGAAARPVNVSINGQSSAGAVEINGSVMVPLRGVFEALGAQVQYIAASRTIVATSGNDRLIMQVGVATAAMNGQSFPLNVAPIMYGGNVLVPLRFIAEGSGATVRWNANTRTVFIESAEGDNSGGMDDYDE